MLRVKIICTIGPASREPEVLTRLIQAGMNVARLNLSHGTHEYHRATIERIRTISEELGKPIAILADLQGPKLRVGKMQPGGVPLRKGEEVVLTVEDVEGKPGLIPIQYQDLPAKVRPGERILIDDGLLELEVLSSSDKEIRARVVIGGTLTDNKGMNLPDASLDIPALTEKDLEDVRFALSQQVDWIALSFVRTAGEVLELKQIIQQDSSFGRVPPVISKIEKPEAVRNIDAIINASDAIMVARGDLGIETRPETVPMVQKMIISKCLAAAKPVITATQMLDSMIRNPRPTRAEASDVANAVLDGSDAIMLSGETASGNYPVESVETMVKIAEEAERALLASDRRVKFAKPEIYTAAGAVCHAAMQTAELLNAKAIIAPTVSGATAKFIASFRPRVPVVAVTPSPMVQRQLCMYWGVYPLLTRRLSNTDEVVNDAIAVAQKHGYVNPGDTVVLTAGVVGSVRSATNLMMVRTIERVLARGIGLGQREIAGRIVRIKTPLNGVEPEIGPQDIVFVDHVDRSCIKLLQRAGGLITRDSGLDSLGAVAAVELGLPAIIGVDGEIDQLVDGKRVILDATTGQVIEWNK
ncbi:pyruvate kinase [Litorilinea aerophila]|uniref:Pyruvate kinase n=1 Tax=Litorilinea aerophila TaxID=1204385 RepID=A0A540VJN5_9CHLR|nr:pyruvate kinase [Litorilinea aerophila]MCC9075443.1 pyruvate kinase [Litorilinea aerophila]GIV76325.1 MAG: pyruvate kinase [Litorilinea sp.]GIV77347.1 MAG: pyruvate kinase [Litorilinea sp.]GIV80492.1 MAG: pyruvate kinase [Litorilinea sp.]